MLFNKFEHLIKEKFGPIRLTIGNNYIVDNEKMKTVYFWGALISKDISIVPNESLLITVVKTNKWHKALMLIPPLNTFSSSLQTVDITQQDDAVMKYFQNINLIYLKEQSSYNLNLKITFANYACHGELQIMDNGSNDMILSMLQIINTLKKQYNNAFVDNYLSKIGI